MSSFSCLMTTATDCEDRKHESTTCTSTVDLTYMKNEVITKTRFSIFKFYYYESHKHFIEFKKMTNFKTATPVSFLWF